MIWISQRRQGHLTEKGTAVDIFNSICETLQERQRWWTPPCSRCNITEPSCMEDNASEELVTNITPPAPQHGHWRTVCTLGPQRGHTVGLHALPSCRNKWLVYLQQKRLAVITSFILWLSATSQQIHAASLLCIHLSWPHFLSMFQGTQYFIRVVRECVIFTMWRCGGSDTH